MTQIKIIISFQLTVLAFLMGYAGRASVKPNIIIIYTDDVGYGDIGCYGAVAVKTPHIDRLAKEGIRFTNAYACASTCTPSRYALLTGEYNWRKPSGWHVGNLKGTSIAPGDAGMLIDTEKPTLPSVLKEAGYSTAVVGKWHLGLGVPGKLDWNTKIKPGPKEIDFDYSFIIPATGDRVPCVYVENGWVVGLNSDDPIHVSFDTPLGADSTIFNPNVTPDQIVSYEKPYEEKLESNNKGKVKMYPSFGHDQTIVNGIPRIGYMTGGYAARSKDETIAEGITGKALRFIEENQANPFLLYFATLDIHVPRVPGKKFAGKSSIGVYGDVLMQMDWCVGEIINKLDELGLTDNTLLIFTSDNGPVQNDGYFDGSDEDIGAHNPTGPYKGGKYSAYEGGTRVPFIVHWPGKVKPGISNALFSQVDIFASLAALSGHENPGQLSLDSNNHLPVLLGQNYSAREYVIQENMGSTLSIVKNDWKYIEPGDGPKLNPYTQPEIELGNSSEPQLFNLSLDSREVNNLAGKYPGKVKELRDLLEYVRNRK